VEHLIIFLQNIKNFIFQIKGYMARQNLFPCNEFHLACNPNYNVRSEVLTAVNMKLVVFWNVMPSSMVGRHHTLSHSIRWKFIIIRIRATETNHMIETWISQLHWYLHMHVRCFTSRMSVYNLMNKSSAFISFNMKQRASLRLLPISLWYSYYMYMIMCD